MAYKSPSTKHTCVSCGTPYTRQLRKDRKDDGLCLSCKKEKRREEARTRTEKRCTKCGVVKELNLTNWPPHNKKLDGYDSWCRSCRSSYRSETRRGHYRHMISDEDLQKELDNFQGCEICGKHVDIPVVDHCHNTDTYRGLLCASCNLGLGKFYDDPELLAKAIEYLK